MRNRFASTLALGLALGILGPGPARARVKLAALPERAQVFLSLTPSGSALVEEERILTLQKGPNQVDFSWRSVAIDAETIRLAPQDHPDKVRIIHVAYPPGENALVWSVFADEAYEERVRISYLLSGVSKGISYRAVVERDEKTFTLKSFLDVDNQSGEDYENVELNLGNGVAVERRLRAAEGRTLLAFTREAIPVKKLYIWDSASMPHEPEKAAQTPGIPVYYLLPNTKDAGFGAFSLEAGKLRMFQKDSSGSQTFLGENWAPFTAVGETMRISVSESRDLSVTRRKMKDEIENARYNVDRSRVLHDRREAIKYELKNFRKEAVSLTLIEHVQGHWDIPECSHKWRRVDAETVEIDIELPPTPAKGNETKPVLVTFEILTKNVRG